MQAVTVRNPETLLAKLKPLPAVARKLLAKIGDEGATIPEISQLVRSDAVFAGEVLRLANSAAMGRRFEVLNVMHAVTVLGMVRLRSLVLTVALRDSLPPAAAGDLARRCWRHNFAAALIAEWLAGACWLDRNDGYTAGLLHGVGRLALVSLHPARYGRMLAKTDSIDGVPAQEAKVFGMDHREAGRWLGRYWEVPPPLVEVMAAPALPPPGLPVDLPVLAAIASQAAQNLGFSVMEGIEGDNAALLDRWLPPDAWESVRGGLGDSFQDIAMKINAFESEFLN